MVPEIGDNPGLVAINDGTSPVPLAPNPIAILLLVHVKVPPAGTLANAEAGTVAPLQTEKFAGTTTVGVGLTVMVYEEGVPGQPSTVEITVMVAVIGVDPGFVAVNEGTLPVPFAGNPIAVLLTVHEYVPPAGMLANTVPGTKAPLQTVKLEGTTTVGVGLTVIV